jgi:hypothetical protein
MPVTRNKTDTNDVEASKVKKLEAQVAKQKSVIATQKKKLSTKDDGSSAKSPGIDQEKINIVKSKHVDQMTKEEKHYRSLIHDETKDFLWPFSKFINSKKKLIKAAFKVMDRMKPTTFQDLVGQELDEAKADWVANNADHVRTGFNEVRNYSQSNVRSEIVGRRISGKWVPTMEQILDCATREEYLGDTEEGKKLFAYYWDVLLMKVAGKKHWDKPIRYHNTISGAVHADRVEHKECITTATEAFLYLLFENCEQKWIHLAKESRKGNKYNPKDIENDVPFIDKNAGQQEWGGWGLFGRDRYKELKAKLDDARARDHVKKLEEDTLKALRIEHNIDVEDGRKSKGKKRKMQEEEEDDDEFD